MDNKKWEIYTRGTVPLYRIGMFDSLRKASLKHREDHFCDNLYACEGGKLWWGWGKKGLEEWGRILMNTLSNKSDRVKHYNKYDTYFERAVKASESIRKKDLSKLSNKEIISLYNFLEKETDNAMGLPNIDLDVFDVYFEGFLQTKIKERLKISDKAFSDIYRELSVPAYVSFISEEEKAIALSALGKKDVEEVYNDFWWTSLGWENIIPRSLDYYKKKVKEYSKKKNLKEIIVEIENRPSVVRKKRNEIIKKYKLGKEINELLEVFDKFVHLHDLRKETQVRIIHSFNLLLIETAKRFNINDREREWYTCNEIVKILKGEKINVEEIKKRRKAILIIVNESGIKMFSGIEAIERRKEELKQEIKNTKELKGTGVTKGKIRAYVKVCNGIQDARKKVKEGDVLVTGMTLPDYVPVMRIASAIITDEGGITCHAAIVSRELKKPCIVGTKIATQVLKDGDLIEVDADNGIVKILKRK